MKIIVLVLAILATSACSFTLENCQAEPTVEIQESKKTENKTEQNTTIIDEIEERVKPGGQVTCTY